MSKAEAQRKPTYDSSSSAPDRSPERAALAAAIQARDAAVEVLAEAVRDRDGVDQRLAEENRALAEARSPDDSEGDPDLEVLIASDLAHRQRADRAEAAISVLNGALASRNCTVRELEDAVGRGEREVEKAARRVLGPAIGRLFEGLEAMRAELVRRRFALAFLLGNERSLNGPGRLSEESEAVRSFLRQNQLPSDDYTPSEHLGDETKAMWAAALERLVIDAAAPLPG